MLEFDGLNYFAVGVVWLVYVVVGAFWYSPAGFGKPWSRLSGVDMMNMPQNEATRTLVYVVLSALVQAVTLGVVLNSLGADSAGDGLVAGLALAVGLVAASSVGNTHYLRLGWAFWSLNAAYFLVVMAIGGAILGAWD
jgi:hypothetical protein